MRLGERLAELLPLPGLVAFYGDLGAGKTALVRGMGRALGAEHVTSPTFTIVHEYATKPPLIHIDAYRLADGDALYDVGFADYLKQNALLVVEWAELVEDALPRQRLNIRIQGSGEEPRTLTLEAAGERYERTVERL